MIPFVQNCFSRLDLGKLYETSKISCYHFRYHGHFKGIQLNFKRGQKLEKRPKSDDFGRFLWCARRDLNPHVRNAH